MPRPHGSDRLPSLEARGRDIVERLGGEWQHGGGMCRCPAHDDRTPSLSVRPGERRLLFHCFAGCEAVKVMRAMRALQLLGRLACAGGDPLPAPADTDGRNRDNATRLWAAARPIGDSPAEAYLRKRGLASEASDLRYHPRTPCGRGTAAIFRPALLAAVRDASGLVGVHRTFVDERSGNIADLAVPKRALGHLGSGAVRLAAPCEGTLGWAEGIESAMAATLLFGIPCWATLGTERFARVAHPSSVTHLILFLDNDAGGRRAETLARKALRSAAVEITALRPEGAGADWNDVLLERARA